MTERVDTLSELQYARFWGAVDFACAAFFAGRYAAVLTTSDAQTPEQPHVPSPPHRDYDGVARPCLDAAWDAWIASKADAETVNEIVCAYLVYATMLRRHTGIEDWT